ncbi:Crp/Fnr family transcriptional regulator [Gymnodinialimonas ceratoperidinii]|uniref:Cyclic nucleotide-binding domain-containing protein n=1 Tax=Gymnodinialimonas ceratoperidinii TaxID=2856823 RepID=A0A8F6TWB8_9RHOB|nr:cyclic nucleotide-binding domain-containing protein [Gymnodinialimonas ceratoperidinii]QXT39870.1 cyclic nucleotide-binding domain-containing protein [Gymnodinialimonas ceratoperidinii]
MTPEIHAALQSVGHAVTFDSGETLRERGAFAPDLLFIETGEVSCILSESDAPPLTVGPGAIVGEIGFLTGQGATATLRAIGPVTALSLDARALQRLRKDAPAVASDVLRHLARLLRARTAENEAAIPVMDADDRIDVVRCSTLDQRRTAQRVRYDVLCLESGQGSPDADDEEGVITDDLDASGTSFIAFTGVQAVGTMRLNFGSDVGENYNALQGVGGAEADLDKLAVISAVAVFEAYRTEQIYGQFFTAIRTFAQASGAEALYMTCPPEHEHLLTAHGFNRQRGEAPSPGPRELSMVLAPLSLPEISDD